MQFDLFGTCGRRLHRAGDVAAGLGDDVLAPLLAEQPDTNLACVDYRAMTGRDTLAIPLALSVPA